MFVQRKDGAITGAWTCKQHEGQEVVRDDAAELVEFMTRPMPVRLDPVEKLRSELEDRGVLTKLAK